MKRLKLLIILYLCSHDVSAQFARYIIKLKDKNGTPYSITDPSKFLTDRSIERRARYKIPIDQTDLPITPRYIDSIRLAGNVTILNVSKWLNQVCILTTDAGALNKINSFPFVLTSAPIGARPTIINPVNTIVLPSINARPLTPANPQQPTDIYNYGQAYNQIHLHNGEFLHNLGFTGKGMALALMDAGFYHYKTLPTFDSVRINNQIAGTWDFVDNEVSVDEDYPHGMNCFSTIAANMPGSFVGTSPKCNFYLFRTEDEKSEYPIEEQNWVAAAEKGDSLGVDVFSVSLGYNTFDNSSFNYSYADMNGKTTLIAKAANLAAKKGILVVVAAGNDGSNSWKYISTPADADSALTVGAVNTARIVASFSSYGPSSNGQVKPDVAAVGQNAVIANQNTGNPSFGNGTSFATPIMAGIATCLWQAFPEVNNMRIIDEIRKSSDRYLNPDNRTGYGIPDAKKAFVSILKSLYTQQINTGNNCEVNINFTVKKGDNMSIIVERKLPSDANYLPITIFNFTGNFAAENFKYQDDLSLLNSGIAIQYRLKMNIGADTSFYLDSTIVNYTQNCNTITEKISISPNPVKDNLKVLIVTNSNSRADVKVFTELGQKLYSGSQKINGTQAINIPFKHFSSGVYFVSVSLDGQKEVVKKIIKN